MGGKDGSAWIITRDGCRMQLDTRTGEMATYYDKDGSQPLAKTQPSGVETV